MSSGYETLDATLYAQLKDTARGLLHAHVGHSVTPTSLVHDAWLRLTNGERAHWESRAHFQFAFAAAMRHALIDRARRRGTEKHGAGWTRVSLSGVVDALADVDLVALSDALDELATIDARGATIVQLRFLGGMTNEDIATLLTVSERTVERDWRAARAWLMQALHRR